MARPGKSARLLRPIARGAAIALFAVGLGVSVVSAKSTLVVKCVDGNPRSLTMVGKNQPPDLLCDVDAERDGVCTFAAPCPLCSMDTPPCLARCRRESLTVWTSVPVKRSKTVDFGERSIVFRCDAGLNPKHHR